ncbi:phage integrase [Teredinibacter turnerae]|uniref:phage integrase n=1 Tax=Teredinibacter turnerae TaxID=2426 RepID=UPI003AFF623C
MATKEWNESKPDNRALLELIDIWYQLLGFQLKDGLRRKNKLIHTCAGLGNPRADKLSPKEFLNYRFIRTENGTSGKTLNNELCYLNSLYNGLKSSGEILYSNPLADIKMLKLDERELSWLTVEEIKTLLNTIEKFSENPHVLILTKVCLATGARWEEAESITVRKVIDHKITFSQTKNGKVRAVPISNGLNTELVGHLEEFGGFSNSSSAFRRALVKSKIRLPKGQAAHVLRHTFASHFMMNGGNILTLQRILGHSSINMTMRYSHLSPDHLLESINLNPLTTAIGY